MVDMPEYLYLRPNCHIEKGPGNLKVIPAILKFNKEIESVEEFEDICTYYRIQGANLYLHDYNLRIDNIMRDLSKTKMIKALRSGAVSNPEIIDILQDKIDELELEGAPEESDNDTSAEEVKFDDSDMSSTANDDSDDRDEEFDDTSVEDTANDFLPSPSDLDVDLSGEAEEVN